MSFKFVLSLAALAASALTCAAQGQQKGQPPAPPLMGCGAHGDVEILCGTRSPEDIELTPDGKFLLVSQFAAVRASEGSTGIVLFDIAKKTYSEMNVTSEPRKDWGDPACPGALGPATARPHGISLSKRNGGAWQLYVVNHGGRQSMEMYELKQTAGTWGLIWHGCVVAMKDYNDVAALPDGSYVATHPTSLAPTSAGPGGQLSGQPSGVVARWTAAKGEETLPSTEAGYPNGVLVSADGRYMYFNAWTAKEVHKYDLKENKEVGMIKLDFMPDNITWTAKHQMIAAGVKGARGDCGGAPCSLAFSVAEINPAKMESQTLFDSEGKGALISGVSVALQTGNSIYIGAFTGDRLVKIARKK